MKQTNFLWMALAIALAMSVNSCSSDDEKDPTFSTALYSYGGGAEGNQSEAPRFSLGDINVLLIQEENGKADTCWLYDPLCGIADPVTVTGSDNIAYEDYPMKFTATVMNSPHFTGLHLGIENRENWNIDDLAVGTSYSTYHFNPFNKLSFSIWGDTYSGVRGAWSGGIEVVGKRTDAGGTTFISISLQDLETCAYDEDWNLHTYFLNGVIEFRICENGRYPKPAGSDFDMETALIPNDYLIPFMMNALYKSEIEGRKTFFSEMEEEKCLIINSLSEFREAYKGDMEIPNGMLNFDYCSLVIGRTYGENGSVSLGDFELTDNGDAYQLDVTLNSYVKPLYNYDAAHHDLYFWKIYPKMENKPVVFNRIRQNVDIDPFGDGSPYAHIRKRWLLESYTDSDGTLHQVSKDWGDERYSIEFKENGRMEGLINTNEFSGYYTLPHMMTIDGKRDGYHGDLHYGLINLRDWMVTEIADEDPLSEVFMRIFDATMIKIWSQDIMTIINSDGECFGFFRENIKEIYGYQ